MDEQDRAESWSQDLLMNDMGLFRELRENIAYPCWSLGTGETITGVTELEMFKGELRWPICGCSVDGGGRMTYPFLSFRYFIRDMMQHIRQPTGMMMKSRMAKNDRVFCSS